MVIVGVTACTTGVAHTYMAAELLVKLAEKQGHQIFVETQGALETSNKLTKEQIDASDVAVIISDIKIEDMERFNLCRIVEVSTTKFLRDPESTMNVIAKIRLSPPQYHVKIDG